MVMRNIKMVTRHGPCQRHRAPIGRGRHDRESVETQARPSATASQALTQAGARVWCNFKRRGEAR